MAELNFGLLAPQTGPTEYEQDQARRLQQQLTQQQLAQSQQATKLGAAQLQKMVEADQRVKQFAEKMRQTGGPEDWRGIAKAMFESGDPENIRHAQSMVEDHKASEALRASFGVGEPEAAAPAPTPAPTPAPAPVAAAPAPAAAPAATETMPASTWDRYKEQFGALGDLTEPDKEPLRKFINNAYERSIAQPNNLAAAVAPATAPAANNLGKTELVLPPVEVKTKPLPTLPTLEQGLMMAGSSHKGTAEAGKRIVDYYEKQPELLKLQAQQNRLMGMGATNKDPEMRAIEDAIKKVSTHAPAVQVINNPQQLEKAESIHKGKSNIDLLDAVSNEARASAKLLPSIDVAERIMNKGFETGFGTDAKVASARLLSAFGVPEATKYASDAATMQAMLTQTVLQRQLEQKGVATEGDAQRIADTSAKLSNPVDANKYILSVARATIQRDQEKKDFFQKWWNTNKTVEGAEQAWDAGPANKSIFTYPALKAYAPATKPTSGPKTPIATAQDKAALDWANANPNDPRAAQIKSRLGQ